jgi:molybdopterin-guanine dinucleotide biosynthesis protein A/molybdopterin converting factor small subunit
MSAATIAGAAAVILAGGKSSRMGQPKALLPFDGEPLILHVVRALKKIFAEAIVVAAPEQALPELPALLVRDEVAYQGPVSGIYHGLHAATQEVCFVTSCDAPFLNLSLIANLTGRISTCDVVVPYWEDRYQPLHAVYRRSCLALLKQQLERNELRPIFLYDKVRTRKMPEDEIRAIDPEGLSFLNMNSPEEYETALRIWKQRPRAETAHAPDSIAVTVELFGAARVLAKTQHVRLELAPEATLAQLFSALAEKLPALAGRVIESDRLVAGYACNINGLIFERVPSAKIHSGDKIFIFSADAGG